METPDDPDSEMSICLAAAQGNSETIRALIKYGANVNPVFRDGTTMYPLRSAIERYHMEIAMILLLNMDLITLAEDPNEQGLLLCTATACGFEVLAKLLLKYGCDPHAVILDDGEIGLEYEEGMSASVWAAAFGHVEVLKLLLDYGADPDWPLLVAIKRGHLHVVKTFLENGTDANCRESCCMQVLSSAIHHEAIFRLLLEHGADSKVREEGEFFLITAITSGQEAVIQILLNFGLTMRNIRDPIHWSNRGN